MVLDNFRKWMIRDKGVGMVFFLFPALVKTSWAD